MTNMVSQRFRSNYTDIWGAVVIGKLVCMACYVIDPLPPLSQVRSVDSGSIAAPWVQVQPSLKLWFWTAPPGRVWSGLRSRWTARASVSTASPSRRTTAARDRMAWTARNPTSWCFRYRMFLTTVPICEDCPRFLLPVVGTIIPTLLVFCLPLLLPSEPLCTFV